MKATDLCEKIIAEKIKIKAEIDVIHVNDGDSRFFGGRFNEDFSRICPFYDALCKFNYISLSSSMFIDIYSKLVTTRETVVVLDNIKNTEVFDIVQKMKLGSFNNTIGSEKIDGNDLSGNDSIRKINLRVIYILDELIWEGIGGRSKSIYECYSVEDLLLLADTIVVPSVELKFALKDVGFVNEDQYSNVVVVPFTVPCNIYPVYTQIKARAVGSVLDKPKILVKGAILSKNICDFVIAKHKKYKFTLCTGSELPDELMMLLANGDVRHIVHYTSPNVGAKNIAHTYLDERDGQYDFVIYSSDSLYYDLASGDADPMLSVASGACVLACLSPKWFTESTHMCCATKTDFSPQTTYNAIDDMVKKYCVTVNWNELYNSQRNCIEGKISDKAVALARLFAVLIGKDMIKKRFSSDVPENESNA